MQCVRQLSGVGGLDYAALEPSCRSLYIASGKLFQFDSDSESAVERKEPEGSKARGTVNSESLPNLQTRIILQYDGHMTVFILVMLTVFILKMNRSNIPETL
jgi:hypothetical protein